MTTKEKLQQIDYALNLLVDGYSILYTGEEPSYHVEEGKIAIKLVNEIIETIDKNT